MNENTNIAEPSSQIGEEYDTLSVKNALALLICKNFELFNYFFVLYS